MGVPAIGGIIISFYFPNGPSCKSVASGMSLGSEIAVICVNIYLIESAYHAFDRNCQLLVSDIISLMLPFPTFLLIFGQTATSDILPGLGCTVIYPQIIMTIKFITNMPINILFVVAFSITTHRQYHSKDNNRWVRLRHKRRLVL
jgi:hypothetical protein